MQPCSHKGQSGVSRTAVSREQGQSRRVCAGTVGRVGRVPVKCNLCHSAVEEKYSLDEFRVMTCVDCGLVALDVPHEEGLAEALYGEDYYQKRKEYFFENVITDPEKGRENDNIVEFAEALALMGDLAPQRGNLLDVGCGIGVFLRMAREDNWHVKGVDISHFACRYARDLLGLEVLQGSLADINLAPESIDFVTMWDALEHLADPAAELKEIGRVLRRGGFLLLNTPNEDGLLRLLACALYKVSLGSLRYPVRKLYHIYHLYYFNASTVSRMLHGSGFRILSFKKKPIATVKARGSTLEKAIVRAFTPLERLLKREYELFIIAQKC